MEAEALLSITLDALTEAREQRDAARALVRRLINGILGGGIDQEYFAALKDARAAVKEWGPS